MVAVAGPSPAERFGGVSSGWHFDRCCHDGFATACDPAGFIFRHQHPAVAFGFDGRHAQLSTA